MTRIAGINIDDQRQIGIGLTGIYGIGRRKSAAILHELNISPEVKAQELTEGQVEQIRQRLQREKVEGDLRTATQVSIKHQVSLQSYRGLRHSKKLPVRGQRTKTNARTKRGKRVTVGSGRKPAAQKT